MMQLRYDYDNYDEKLASSFFAGVELRRSQSHGPLVSL